MQLYLYSVKIMAYLSSRGKQKIIIMAEIPSYVYALFIALLWMGIVRCFPRTVRVERLFVIPVLITVLGFRGFHGLFPILTRIDFAMGLIGWTFGFISGWSHARRWTVQVDKSARSITIPGDIMMLFIILATFIFEFALHYGIEAKAVWASARSIEIYAALVWGFFLGMPAGRNMCLARRYLRAGVPY